VRVSFVFGLVTFLTGWVLQSFSFHLWFLPWPPPQWLLLSVLALGASGRTMTAQTLGFLWGLSLDAHGASLVGAQAWLLATSGFVAGILSWRLDAEKLSAQELLSLAATVFFFAGMVEIELLFRWPGPPHRPGAGMMVGQLIMNGLAAPIVFWIVEHWKKMWGTLDHDHVFNH
jgi:rod shape-determining protein MreD